MGVKDSFLGRLLASSDKFTDEQVTQTVDLLVSNGVKHRASDIHIEPHERYGLVRFRIDGHLKGMHKLPLTALPAVIERIKTLAHLHAGEEFIPQEGHYATLVGEDQFEVQVNTLPVVGGEKIVLHISRRLSTPPSLEALGFWGHSLETLQTALSRPHGLILVATPRRSGRTTSLHSMLQLLNIPAVSVATVENEIVYRLTGASQTHVRPQRGVTFHEGLQAALNQDPNVVMVSSIPDKATADLAVQASAGGHMILAGMHTDSSTTALTHLRSMSDEPFLLATATRAAVSQRLVRQLCTHCRERYVPSPEQIDEIEQSFGATTAAAKRRVHELEQQATNHGVDSNKHINSTPSHITHLWRASEEGCERCNHSGYQGVIAIVEVLEVSKIVQKALLDHTPAHTLHDQALKEGFIPIGLDGLVKALRGQTTVAEVLRIITV